MTRILATIKGYRFRHFNIRLLVWVCALTILGINVIASATKYGHFEKKQILGFILGLIVMFTASLISYKYLLKYYWVMYIVNLILLIWVKVSGAYRMGAVRWIDFGFFQLQPSEFTKLFLILFFAKYFSKYKDKLNTWRVLLGGLVLFAIPLILVLKQPDLSTSIVICLTFCGIIYVAGLNYKIISVLLAITIPVVTVFVYLVLQPNQKILEQYQYERLIGFYKSDSEVSERISLQQKNSIMAIGSGGLWGKGLNNNTTTSVKNGNYISEPQTDFIFCIVGEELGFVGAASVIILLLLIIIECLYIAANAPDYAGRLIAAGFGILITIQSFVNIGVVTMILPNTGLPLPFVSYGLSSLLSMFAAIGVILNIGMQRKEI